MNPIHVLRHRAQTAQKLARARLHQRRHDRSGQVEFIHINKTGGSSVERGLGLPFHHQNARARLDLLGIEEWNRRYSFTFVRNPWDRLVSQYHHRKGRGRLRVDLDFRDWVRATLVDRDPHVIHRAQMFDDQLAWISNAQGDVVVDDVYRYESLHDDFARLCAKIGVAGSLPHLKPSKHTHYSAYYDDETVEVVGAYFTRDVELFGYRFEREA